ncbi:MAG: AbrB/MazE/SpoVT family DNA-binding domain-containing protein [Nanoarchaeota archaeon]
MEITSISSRGQVVIPQKVRKKLELKEGEKFIVIGKNNVIVLKKIEMPSFDNFNQLLKETQKFAEKKGVTSSNLNESIKRTRKK